MPKSRIPSPSRSQGAPITPRRGRPRRTRSVASPALSTASGRLTSVIEHFKENNMDSFALSLLSSRRSVLTDNTDIEEPRRRSWWKNLKENSRDVMEVLENNKVTEDNHAIEELIDIEVLSQEKKNYTLDLPESSGSESINSIVLPQRKLFTQKDNQAKTKFGQLVNTRESLAKKSNTTTHSQDKSFKAGTKELFQGTKRTKPIFPAALLNITPNKTIADKTKELPAEPKQTRNIFGNRPTNKRKNMFANFIVSDSEDEILDIQPKVFGFQRKVDPVRGPEPRLSHVTADIDMDDWKHLPSSTMVEHQLEEMMRGNTPVKRARLESQEKESNRSRKSVSKRFFKIQEDIIDEHVDESPEKVKQTVLEMLETSDEDNGDEEIQQAVINQLDINKEDAIDGAGTDNEVENQGIVDNANKDAENYKEKLLPQKVNNEDLEQSLQNEAEIANISHKNVDKEVDNILYTDKINNIENDGEENVGQKVDESLEIENEVNESHNVEDGEDVENEQEDQATANKSQIIEPHEQEKEVGGDIDHDSNVGDEYNVDINDDVEENDHGEENDEVESSSDLSQEVENNASGDENNQSEDNIDDNEEVNDDNNESQLNEVSENETRVEDDAEESDIENDHELEDNENEQEVKDVDDSEEVNNGTNNESQVDDDSKESDIENDHELEDNENEQEVKDVDDSEEVNNETNNESQVNDDSKGSDIENDQELEDNENNEEMENSVDSDKAIASEAEADDEQVEEMEVDEEDPQELKYDSDIEENRDQNESTEEIEGTPNTTHDTTGRNRKKALDKSPEVILHEKSNQADSFTAQGNNTSVRKTMIKSLHVSPSMAPPRESTGVSSAEGSGWDSHRTTRKTLRQTFGKDFTMRKSLRAMVMEKSAKRHTEHLEIPSDTAQFPEANSTELPDESDRDADEMDVESDHELSRRTRQTILETQLQRIKQNNMEERLKIREAVRNSINKKPTRDPLNIFIVPTKPAPRRPKPAQSSKKQIKTITPFGSLPPELIEDLKYKPPKRFQPASWTTKRLYKFLETKLEPKYDYKARVRAEKLVETIFNFVKEIRRHKTAPVDATDVLKHEMARLDIVKTHFEFYEFFHEYMPREVRIKVVPDIVNMIPLPRHGVFAEILHTVQ